MSLRQTVLLSEFRAKSSLVLCKMRYRRERMGRREQRKGEGRGVEKRKGAQEGRKEKQRGGEGKKTRKREEGGEKGKGAERRGDNFVRYCEIPEQ